MNAYLAMDAANVKAEIDRLLTAYPELAEDETLRLDTLDGETNLTAIIERALTERQDALSMVGAVKERMDALAVRKGRYERKDKAMKALIKGLMEVADIPKLQLAEATLSVTSPRMTVNVLNVDELPQGYYRTKKEADKTALKSALEQGEQIPGAELVLGESGLTVRTK